jgi:hypothetical protein
MSTFDMGKTSIPSKGGKNILIDKRKTTKPVKKLGKVYLRQGWN